MRKATTKIMMLFITMLSVLTSCDGNHKMLVKMDEIKRIGNTSPKLAMQMMDSIDSPVNDYSEYVRMKYLLLDIRIKDELDTLPTSDITVSRLTEYFKSHGDLMEQQEAYYYAGSVYRELHDTPRALTNFLTSINVANKTKACDSILLRNAYSNLQYLYYNVQDYQNALNASQDEYRIAKELGSVPVNTVMHLGNSYMATGNTRKAAKAYDEILSKLSTHDNAYDPGPAYMLLYQYSTLGIKDKADRCYAIVHGNSAAKNAVAYNALGTYFSKYGSADSAIACFQHILADGKEPYYMYDAAKALFHIYTQRNNMGSANASAARFMKLSEELDLGQKQRFAATVNNEFQYHLDHQKLEDTEMSRQLYRRIILIVAIGSLLLLITVYAVFTKRRNILLKQKLMLAGKICEMESKSELMKNDIEAQKAQLANSKAELDKRKAMLDTMSQDIAQYTTELDESNHKLEEARLKLEEAKQKLEEKRLQSQSLMQMLHQTALQTSAEEIIISVRQAAKGKRHLSAHEWSQLIAAIDKKYPTFKSELLHAFKKMSEQQLQVYYMAKIGLTNPQMQNITDLPRTTLWRWSKAFSEKMGEEIK